MIERYGDIFDTAATYIAHGVNVQGVMGAGIAKAFKDRFPQNYSDYALRCRLNSLLPGEYLTGRGELNGRNVVIVNLASQQNPGADATYAWLFEALQAFAETASNPTRLQLYGGIVAIPEIGCGIGGLEWDKVKAVLECIEKMYPSIEFEVWHYQPKQEGIVIHAPSWTEFMDECRYQKLAPADVDWVQTERDS